MKNKKRNITSGILIALSVALFFITGYLIGKQDGYFQAKKDYRVLVQNPIDMTLFWDVYNILKEKFYRPENFDKKELLYGAIKGMTRSLKDPYTEFLPPSLSKTFFEDVKGEFGGVGFEIGIRNNILTVVAPLKGTPAERAGIKAGDKILAVDGKSTQDMGLLEAVKLIRGEPGTKVELLIYRDSFKTPKIFKITRAIIKIPVYEISEISKGVYHLKLFNFNETSYEEVFKAVYSLKNNNLKGLILDLRNNPGGVLEEAVSIAGFFLKKGTLVVEETREGKVLKEYRSKGPGVLSNIPIVILINKGTASAAEILAGALKDNLKNVEIIGEKSFGKGTVQALEMLEDGSALKYTIAEWVRPSGKIINEKGIEPDIEVKDKNLEDEKDEVLQEAIKEINSKL